MCGIYGIIGEMETCIDFCLDGLKNLEYRGYDSAGIAGFVEEDLVFCKEIGRLENLKKGQRTKPEPLNGDCSYSLGNSWQGLRH